MSWITVDLDYPTPLRLLKTYSLFNRICRIVEFRRSSRKGVHFRGFVEEDVDFNDRAFIRFLAMDDINRMTMDFHRRVDGDIYDTEVLWDMKDKDKVGRWESGFDSLDKLIDSLEVEYVR